MSDPSGDALLSQFLSPPTRKILKAHSGGGGGLHSSPKSKPIRRTGPPGTQPSRKRGTGAADDSLASTTNSLAQFTIHTNRSRKGKQEESKEQSPFLSAASSTSSSTALTAAPASSSSPSSVTASGVGGASSLKSHDDPVMSDKQSLCIDILVAGHVNSFVDFFYLTHRAEEDSAGAAAAAANGGAPAGPPPIPDHKLGGIMQHLTTAERAHRRGDSEAVYASYEALAHDFHASADYKTSIYFYEKCLDMAEAMEDLAQQCNSNLNLGLTHDAMGDTAAAIRFHEKHKEIAAIMGATQRLLTANQQLVETYRRYAEEHEKKGDHNTAVLLYKRCLQAAQEAGDLRNEGLATYRLGVAYAALGEKHESVEYQQKYLHICKRIGDQLGEGAACAALAQSFKEMGQTELAVSYLEKYQAIAQRNKQSVAQAEACAALGSIHSAGGDHHQAVNCFEKTFEIARTVGDRSLVDNARIHLGMARGDMALEQYMSVVKDNLPALLNWKTKRQQFKHT